MKPIIRRAVLPGVGRLYGAFPPPMGWICQTHDDDASGWDHLNERNCTWSDTPAEAWRKWFERMRKQAAGMIPTGSTFNILGGSRLHQKCQGLIDHDRYLLKVDSRQPGGKGNM